MRIAVKLVIFMPRGVRYKLPIVASFLEWSHGARRCIEEIYLPEYGVAFNEGGYIFKTSQDRYKSLKLPSGETVECEVLGDVNIDESDVKLLVDYVKLKEEAEKLTNKYFRGEYQLRV